MRIWKRAVFVIAGICLLPGQTTAGDVSVVSTAKDMFAIVVPVAALLLVYERRLAKVEQKLDGTHDEVTKLRTAIERML